MLSVYGTLYERARVGGKREINRKNRITRMCVDVILGKCFKRGKGERENADGRRIGK